MNGCRWVHLQVRPPSYSSLCNLLTTCLHYHSPNFLSLPSPLPILGTPASPHRPFLLTSCPCTILPFSDLSLSPLYLLRPFPPLTSSYTAVAPLPSPPVDCSSQLSSALIPHRPFHPQLAITQAIFFTIILFRHIRSCSSIIPIDIVSSASEDAPQEYHIMKITDEAVCMQSTSSSGSIVHKVAEPFLTVVACSEVRECSIGPLPPSLPVSNGHPDEDQMVDQVQGLDPVPPFKCGPVSIAPRYRSPRLSFSSTHNS